MAEAEERECRICRGEDEPSHPLLHPCRCSGSIKYTHEDCLVNWLAQSGSSRCELCNHPFRFEPLYQPNTPRSLPWPEFLVGVLGLVSKTMRTAARIVLVFTVWLFFLPVGTCWTWYALFINSPSQLPALLASRGPAGVATDAFYGCLLSAGIVCVFLGVSSLREYVRHFPHDIIDQHEEDPYEFDNDGFIPDDLEDFSSDDDGYIRPLEGGVGPPEVALDAQAAVLGNEHREVHRSGDDGGNDSFPEDGAAIDPEDVNDLYPEVVDEVDNFMRDTYDVIAGGDDSEDDGGAMDGNRERDSDDDEEQLFDAGNANTDRGRLMEYHENPSDDDYDESSSDYMDDDANIAGPLHEEPEVIGELDPHVGHEDRFDDEIGDNGDAGADGGPLFGLFELDPDEVPLEEVVGLRGHIRTLFDNAGTVLVSNAIFLGVFTLIPLLIGRLTLRVFALRSFSLDFVSVLNESSVYTAVSSVIGNIFSDASVDTLEGAGNVSVVLAGGGSPQIIVGKHSLEKPMRYASILAPLRDTITLSASSATASTSETMSSSATDQPLVSYVDNFLIVLLGYGIIAIGAVGYIGVMSVLRRRYPTLDAPITRQVARLLRYVATFVKIVVLILFEFGIFPLGCGWMLDVCTLEILGGSMHSRLSFCHNSPWTCAGGHWVTGIVYMVHISLFISLLREVIRPQLLWFLRNPDDPEFHPFRELVEKPLSRHARRMCISVIIYVPLILALVYVPGQLCLKLLPDVFPFRSEDFSHILIDVPFGNLLVGPLIRLLYFGHLGISLHGIVGGWVHFVSSALGIAHLVVKEEHLDDDAEARPDQNADDVQFHDEVIEGLPAGDGGPLRRMFADNDGLNAGMDGESMYQPEAFDGAPHLDVGLTEREVKARAAVMISCAWLTLIVAESAVVAIPTILGRFLMSSFGLPVRHDLHPFLLGLNVLFGTVSVTLKAIRYLRTVDTLTALSLGLPYLFIAGKGSVIIILWLGVIPLAGGLLFELILVPVRVSSNETPYFCLHQDWALGLLLLKVWTCIAVTGGLGSKWRERVLRAREGDIVGLNQNFPRTMREVVIPVLFSVVTALSVPYSVARGLLPLLGVARWVSNLVYRYAYLMVTFLYCGVETLQFSVSKLRDLHDSIRDHKYLVGKRLYNFMEPSEVANVGE